MNEEKEKAFLQVTLHQQSSACYLPRNETWTAWPELAKCIVRFSLVLSKQHLLHPMTLCPGRILEVWQKELLVSHQMSAPEQLKVNARPLSNSSSVSSSPPQIAIPAANSLSDTKERRQGTKPICNPLQISEVLAKKSKQYLSRISGLPDLQWHSNSQVCIFDT